MTGRTQDVAPATTSLHPGLTGPGSHVPSMPLIAASSRSVPLPSGPTSNQESDMHVIPEQLARAHREDLHRQAEHWRHRRAALAARQAAAAARKAEQAERRARLARDAASLAAREASALAAVR
jgi:hypothetical protein